MSSPISHQSLSTDQVLRDIADYVVETEITSTAASSSASNCLMDVLGCGILALNYQACRRLLGLLLRSRHYWLCGTISNALRSCRCPSSVLY
ncbi:hypothetical protein EPA93_19370 [Ktedonosporobacter rubrisoli]|uniref:MmgE/PrpD N-terminal domain-containing protein n=1 Tax=Ktedonosporobacter rubrisoli TaxID=2509675 RepID=A0A4P6JRE7_KTERU|nr:MmgE/PrpD family protein [Ktedonosporobacter rubrisoli]QBD78037.1 hypothetical protein EPA93_19370 [Ktedonosporobacter rubrisoli]